MKQVIRHHRKEQYKVWMLTFCLCIGLVLQAQEEKILTPGDFINRVKQFHPLAKQANLLPKVADAQLQSARGGFDPIADYGTDQKTLDGTRYFDYRNGELKIPTLGGIEFKAGYENSAGNFINPESTNGVLSYAGIELPLLKNLLIDKRRASLRQAKIYRSQSEQERLAMLNDLINESYNAYWQWAASYQLFSIYKNYVDVSTRRLKLVRISFDNGDRSLSDTVEAYTQLQQFELMQLQALQHWRMNTIELANYLWDPTEDPFLLPEVMIPDTVALQQMVAVPDIDPLVQQIAVAHPELRTYQFKLQGLQTEKRLKFQELLPALNLRANTLSKDYFTYKGFGAGYLENNYKFGIQFRMPLLLRQGRGAYKEAKLKINATEFQRDQKQRELQSKLRQYYTEAMLLANQLQVAENMYRNYAFLQRNEELRFSQGESSLFLVNSRENKTLESQQKIIELRLKYLKAVNAITWAAGLWR